jgi:hypothetical protein
MLRIVCKEFTDAVTLQPVHVSFNRDMHLLELMRWYKINPFSTIISSKVNICSIELTHHYISYINISDVSHIIENLDISEVEMYSNFANKDLYCKLFQTFTNLKNLTINSTFNCSFISMIQTVFPILKSLIKLDITHMKKSPELIRSLSGLPSLQTLVLDREMDDTFTILLAEILPTIPSLKELSMQHSYFGDNGASVLAGVLMNMPEFQTLNLKSNYSIGTVGTNVLREANFTVLYGPFL